MQSYNTQETLLSSCAFLQATVKIHGCTCSQQPVAVSAAQQGRCSIFINFLSQIDFLNFEKLVDWKFVHVLLD